MVYRLTCPFCLTLHYIVRVLSLTIIVTAAHEMLESEHSKIKAELVEAQELCQVSTRKRRRERERER